MPNAKYQLEDFLVHVNGSNKAFVQSIHELLLKERYKPKIQVTKSTGLQLAYVQPNIKTVVGIILIFFVRDDQLMIRIYGTHHKAYLDVLSALPETIEHQIASADDCKKFVDPTKCWAGCMGYDFHIRGTHYQKCAVNCFQFEVDAPSMPHLLALIKSESQQRMAAMLEKYTL